MKKKPKTELSEYASALSRSRWAKIHKKKRREENAPARKGLKEYWAKMTKEEISEEMTRRRALGLERKKSAPKPG